MADLKEERLEQELDELNNCRYVFLTEQPEMWAAAIIDLFNTNGIPFRERPANDRRLIVDYTPTTRIYVPAGRKEEADKIMKALFPDGLAETAAEESIEK